MFIDTSQDARFSRVLPGHQLQVNSSSLGPFKTCPRQYYYKIICGWEGQAKSVHLTFGTLVHEGLAGYEILRAQGLTHDEALESTIDWALRKTWNKELKRGWISGSPEKNRLGLVRTLVWYLDHYADMPGMEVLRLPNGNLAVEIDFEFDSGWESETTGEHVTFIGKLDRLVKVGNETFVLDTKTTTYQLGLDWFKKFTPDNQFSLYSMAGGVVLDQPVRGLILDGVQVGATFSRFERGPVGRSEAFLDEWLQDSHYWLDYMAKCAEDGYWPMNDRGCGMFGGCEFREICSHNPASRDMWIKAGFVQKKRGVEEDLL